MSSLPRDGTAHVRWPDDESAGLRDVAQVDAEDALGVAIGDELDLGALVLAGEPDVDDARDAAG